MIWLDVFFALLAIQVLTLNFISKNLESEEFDDLDGNGNFTKGNSSGRASVKSCFAAN